MKKCIKKDCDGEAYKIREEIDKTAAIGSIAASFADPLAGLALSAATITNKVDIYKCKVCGYEFKE